MCMYVRVNACMHTYAVHVCMYVGIILLVCCACLRIYLAQYCLLCVCCGGVYVYFSCNLALYTPQGYNIISVAPIIGSAIGYRPIIGIVMHIGISGGYPYRFFFFFFLLRCIFQASSIQSDLFTTSPLVVL